MNSIISIQEAAARVAADRAKREASIAYDAGREAIVIPAGGHYEIPLRRIPSPEKLLGWVAHISVKRWATADIIGTFVSRVSALKGWSIHRL